MSEEVEKLKVFSVEANRFEWDLVTSSDENGFPTMDLVTSIPAQTF